MKLKLGNIEVELQPIDLNLTPKEIKELRKVTGLSMDGFARLCDVSHSTLYFWESGMKKPGRRSKSKLLEIIRSIAEQQNSMAVVEER